MEQSHTIPEASLEVEVQNKNWIEDGKPDSFEQEVLNGIKGLNKGFSGGLKRLDKLIHGIQKGRYYLVGADSGVGKTTLVDFYFVLCAWLDAKKTGKKIKMFYVSLEIGAFDKKARWCSFYLGWKYGLNFSASFILGRVPGKTPNAEQLKLIQEAYAFVELVLQDVVLISASTHPTAIFTSIVEDHYAKHGIVYRKPQTQEDAKKGRKGIITGYTPNDTLPDTYLIVDHLALLDTESGLDMKGTMDRMSKQAVTLRNIFKLTCIFIQQFNTELMASRREAIARRGVKDAGNIITPQRLDFGDSKYTFRDCNVAIGLVKPAQFDLAEYDDFNCQPTEAGGFGEYFIEGFLMKNRDGASDKRFPLFVNPVSGIFYDLPYEYGADEQWYAYAKKLKEEHG